MVIGKLAAIWITFIILKTEKMFCSEILPTPILKVNRKTEPEIRKMRSWVPMKWHLSHQIASANILRRIKTVKMWNSIMKILKSKSILLSSLRTSRSTKILRHQIPDKKLANTVWMKIVMMPSLNFFQKKMFWETINNQRSMPKLSKLTSSKTQNLFK